MSEDIAYTSARMATRYVSMRQPVTRSAVTAFPLRMKVMLTLLNLSSRLLIIHEVFRSLPFNLFLSHYFPLSFGRMINKRSPNILALSLFFVEFSFVDLIGRMIVRNLIFLWLGDFLVTGNVGGCSSAVGWTK